VALPDPDPPHLASAAAVAEAAVIGLPHSALGEEVGLAVALKPGAAVTAAARLGVTLQAAIYLHASDAVLTRRLLDRARLSSQGTNIT
jgi:acyl-coenzyme A synthetase/AMP-(fatty) acid ligase